MKKKLFFPPQNSTWFYVKYMGISVKTEPVTDTLITFTMRPFESTIQILLAASSFVSPSLAMAIISR